MPYCFSRSYVKFQGHTALKIVKFDPNWAFPDCNSSLNSPMAMKCCTNRVSSGQGKVREIPDLAKVREKSGNLIEGQGKNEYWEKVREKSGNLHLVQSKL